MTEYINKAMALAQDAAKLSLRFSEGLMGSALEFGLGAPGNLYDYAEFKLAQTQVRQNLTTGTEKEKVTEMKRLLAAIAKGHDASEFFADVVKNVASGNMEMRRLVYMYLLRYAEQEPDLALLSVNTFQRDLADSNQVIRAMALRVMSSIRVPVISPIVMMAIRKLSQDRSPHVRKTAALAVPKLLRLDPSLRDEMESVVGEMLVENSPLAVGSVIQAFCAVCPTKYDLMHRHYRRWCQMVTQLDEWGQLELVKLLMAYARTQFASPEKKPLDPDHELLLQSIHPLLQSRNSAVVIAVVSAYFHLAPANQMGAIAKPLVRLMRAGRETAYVVLTNILRIAQRIPSIFHAHVRSFFVAASDPPLTRRLKLRVLTLLVSRETVGVLVPEIAGYTRSAYTDINVGAINVMLACAQQLCEASVDCFQSLLLLLQSEVSEEVANAAMHAVRVLLLDGSVRDSQDRRTMTLYDILCYLARLLDRCKADVARAHVYALMGEFAQTKFGCLHALDVLRAAARAFKEEGPEAKMQILELSSCLSKILASEPGGSEGEKKAGPLGPVLQENRETTVNLHSYLFTLARYDTSYDVRDRARMLRALSPLPGDEAHTAEMACVAELSDALLLSRGTPGDFLKLRAAEAETLNPGFTISSLSLTLDRPISGYAPLSDWPATKPVGVDRGAAAAATVGGVGNGSGRNVGMAGDVGSRAITIAGISGRAQPQVPAGTDYSTPRSGAGDDNDDLDAFLNSEDDHGLDANARQAAYASQALHRSAVVYRSSGLTFDTESSEEDEESSEEEGSSSEDDGDEGEESDGEDSEESSEEDGEGDRDSERNPFIEHNPKDKSLGLDRRAKGKSSSGAEDHGKESSSEDSDDDDDDRGYSHTRPLIEDTSKYWQ
ncbi:AP-3 complex subunit beta [Coemansia sp. Benny D115]|nr:AP-3 complex subunit beta [Coemansia sp. Benny D115]